MAKYLIAAALLVAATPAYAMTYFLVAQWNKGGSNYCEYGNGTIINMGYRICPLSIQG